jgi:hypothetical protein
MGGQMPDYGSLTKEFPLANVERTINAITPNMRYSDLRQFARANTQSDIPGLLKQRFLLIDRSNRIVYDEFLALVRREGIGSPITRKVMFFTWLYRDDRLRRFVTEENIRQPRPLEPSRAHRHRECGLL